MKLNVEGMTCEHCQKAVKEALEGISGVDRAEVNLEAGSAQIHGSADTQVLISAVEDEGYTATLAN